MADQKGDYIATKIMMGHADHSISDIYRQEFSKRRLMRVAKHVRKWFLSGRPKLQVVGEDAEPQAG
ncbi:hypothetical protein [Roseimaritima ulvae]|uniref:Phage integrase family protein n=1 Tax=Roseimaritima ulvae TaxID=980254 RepID=A0A5B9QXL6_9BACT|nr:hypothetical protein [Roseimaritima ulvae]QEG43758.1 hypothetical protein UC8_58130 [Roseimaritima ulvae]